MEIQSNSELVSEFSPQELPFQQRGEKSPEEYFISQVSV